MYLCTFLSINFLWTYIPTYLPTDLPTHLPSHTPIQRGIGCLGAIFLSRYRGMGFESADLVIGVATYLPTYRLTYLPIYLPIKHYTEEH